MSHFHHPLFSVSNSNLGRQLFRFPPIGSNSTNSPSTPPSSPCADNAGKVSMRYLSPTTISFQLLIPPPSRRPIGSLACKTSLGIRIQEGVVHSGRSPSLGPNPIHSCGLAGGFYAEHGGWAESRIGRSGEVQVEKCFCWPT